MSEALFFLAGMFVALILWEGLYFWVKKIKEILCSLGWHDLENIKTYDGEGRLIHYGLEKRCLKCGVKKVGEEYE